MLSRGIHAAKVAYSHLGHSDMIVLLGGLRDHCGVEEGQGGRSRRKVEERGGRWPGDGPLPALLRSATLPQRTLGEGLIDGTGAPEGDSSGGLIPC